MQSLSLFLRMLLYCNRNVLKIIQYLWNITYLIIFIERNFNIQYSKLKFKPWCLFFDVEKCKSKHDWKAFFWKHFEIDYILQRNAVRNFNAHKHFIEKIGIGNAFLIFLLFPISNDKCLSPILQQIGQLTDNWNYHSTLPEYG